MIETSENRDELALLSHISAAFPFSHRPSGRQTMTRFLSLSAARQPMMRNLIESDIF
jgi:hypothetical protein